MTVRDVGKKFLNYYASQGYEIIPGSSLLDPTVPMSFVMSAGLVQVERSATQVGKQREARRGLLAGAADEGGDRPAAVDGGVAVVLDAVAEAEGRGDDRDLMAPLGEAMGQPTAGDGAASQGGRVVLVGDQKDLHQ